MFEETTSLEWIQWEWNKCCENLFIKILLMFLDHLECLVFTEINIIWNSF